MIPSQGIVDKFRLALSEKWGYIFGQSGATWTQSDQKLKVNYMIKNFGENWKKNADAKKNKYYPSALNGSKWIGHKVADCSGMFVWVYRQYGLKIAHGSSSIYKSYCSKKGRLTDALKKTILPGTAVFTGDTESNHPHIGLYVGNGKCIEAAGVDAGVITSNITSGKWKWYGELKAVSYPASEATEQPSEPADEQEPIQTLPTLKRGSKGEYVSLLQTKLVNKGYSVGSYGIDGDFGLATLRAVQQFQRDNGLTPDGIVGAKTWAALNDSAIKIPLYTVIIPHLTVTVADKLLKEYAGSVKDEERG